MNANALEGVLLALNPVVIGLLGVYIAYQQWHTNHLKLRSDLYERRLAVYMALMDHLSRIMKNADIDFDGSVLLLQKTRESYFLFGKKVAKYLDTIYDRSIDLHGQIEKLHTPGLVVGEERAKLADRNTELLKWFGAQLLQAREIFKGELSLH